MLRLRVGGILFGSWASLEEADEGGGVGGRVRKGIFSGEILSSDGDLLILLVVLPLVIMGGVVPSAL